MRNSLSDASGRKAACVSSASRSFEMASLSGASNWRARGVGCICPAARSNNGSRNKMQPGQRVAQCRLAQPYPGGRLRDTPLGREGIEDEEKVQIERFELH